MSLIARTAVRCAAALVISAGLACTADAGWTDGTYGAGYPVTILDGLDADGSGMIDNGEAPTAAQQGYLDRLKSEYGDVMTDDQALARAAQIKSDIEKAIEQVKCRDATIGMCLEMLLKSGALCVGFNMPNNVAGVATNDGEADCNAADRIKISGRFLQSLTRDPGGDPFLWDNNFMELVLTLLHEGKHAIQSFEVDTTGLDACKAEAARRRKIVCNESDNLAGSKGAHVIEQEWIDELKAALDALKATAIGDPDPTPPGASDATKKVIKQIRDTFTEAGELAARNAIIDGMKGYICGIDMRTDTIVTCYGVAKNALQAFIDSSYTNPATKAVALQAMRDALNDARWNAIVSRFGSPRIFLLSRAVSGVIDQYDELGVVTTLDTGWDRVSDMEMLLGDDSGLLIVSGGDTGGAGEIQIYNDFNSDGLFATSEQIGALTGAPGLTVDIEIIEMSLAGEAPLLLDLNTGAIWPMEDLTGDDIPDVINAPVYTLNEPPSFVQSGRFDAMLNGVLLSGVDVANKSATPFEDPVLFLPGQNFDGDPLNDQEIPVDFYATIRIPPAFDHLPQPGDANIAFGAAFQNNAPPVFFDVQHIGPDNLPVENLANGQVPSRDIVNAPLSRPLQLGDRVRIADSVGRHSPLIQIGCDGADINGDGVTNGADLGLLLGAWGSNDPCFDLNGDGSTDGADLGLLLGAWS